MTDRELRRLRRDDLLQILITQQKQIEELNEALDKANNELSDRRIAIEESGTLAEAALRLNSVFEKAQAAADLYVSEIRTKADAMLEKARAEAEEILQGAREAVFAGEAAQQDAEDEAKGRPSLLKRIRKS